MVAYSWPAGYELRPETDTLTRTRKAPHRLLPCPLWQGTQVGRTPRLRPALIGEQVYQLCDNGPAGTPVGANPSILTTAPPTFTLPAPVGYDGWGQRIGVEFPLIR